MLNIFLTEEEIIRKSALFLNDPRRLQLISQKAHIIERSIPLYIFDKNTKEFKTIYDMNTQKILNSIDEQIKSIIDSYRLIK